MDIDKKLPLFDQAVAALGGVLPTARALDISRRTIQRFLDGQMQPNDGVVADMADALRKHARDCALLALDLEGLGPNDAGN
jgi:hypothetical protein